MHKTITKIIFLCALLYTAFLIAMETQPVVIEFTPWRIETGIGILVTVLLILYLCIFFILYLLSTAINLPSKIARLFKGDPKYYLEKLIVALANRDAHSSRKILGKIPHPSITKACEQILQAQVAELASINREPQLLSLIHNKETKIVGLTGMLALKYKQEAWEEVILYANQLQQFLQEPRIILYKVKALVYLDKWEQLLTCLPAMKNYLPKNAMGIIPGLANYQLAAQHFEAGAIEAAVNHINATSKKFMREFPPIIILLVRIHVFIKNYNTAFETIRKYSAYLKSHELRTLLNLLLKHTNLDAEKISRLYFENNNTAILFNIISNIRCNNYARAKNLVDRSASQNNLLVAISAAMNKNYEGTLQSLCEIVTDLAQEVSYNYYIDMYNWQLTVNPALMKEGKMIAQT